MSAPGSKPSEKEWTLFVCPTCGYVTPVRLTAGGPEHESFFTCDGTLKLVEDDRGFYEKAASHEPIACERVRVAPVGRLERLEAFAERVVELRGGQPGSYQREQFVRALDALAEVLEP